VIINNLKKIFKSIFLFLFSIILFIAFSGCGLLQTVDNTQNPDNNNSGSLSNKDGVLKVNYIDVGQADSILIQSPDGFNMLIDAGETKNNAVVDYLNSCNVKKLDVIVATHPHSDHISEMASVIKNFDVGEFYMPKKEHTTKDFENMLDALSQKKISPKEAKAGVSLNLGKDVKCNMVAPCKNNYDNLNNWSAVVKLSYGNNSFLFTGDAESLSEKEIVSSGADIKANVLKVGHHGSSSSTSKEFLLKVNPDYAVISAAKVNDYGHPHKETLKKLNDLAIKIFGTYDDGNIVAISDGKNIEFNTKNGVQNNIKASETENTSSKNDTRKNNGNSTSSNQKYIGNKNSKKFHLPSCSNLPSEKNKVLINSKEEAENMGYSPCSNCNP